MWLMGSFMNATASNLLPAEGCGQEDCRVSVFCQDLICSLITLMSLSSKYDRHSLLCWGKNSIHRQGLLLRPRPGFASGKHFTVKRAAYQLAPIPSSWILPLTWHFSLRLPVSWSYWSPKSTPLPFIALGQARTQIFSLGSSYEKVECSQNLYAVTKEDLKKKNGNE